MALALELLLRSVRDLFSSVLGLILFFGGAAVQGLWLWSTEETKEKTRWTLLILSAALSLVCPVLYLCGKEFVLAFLAAGAFPYAVILLSGALAGTVLYQILKKFHLS